MNFVRYTTYAGAALALVAAVACSGDKSDPKTFSPSDLNPATGLMTVTGDEAIELRWGSANTEEGFKGFHVFAIKKDLATIQALEHTYPKASLELSQASIPRCADNTLVFEAFKLPVSKKDCDGAKEAEETSELMATEETATEEETEKLTGIVKCEEGSTIAGEAAEGNDDISLPAADGKALGQNSCIVKNDSEGNALANGETYTFFVMAVTGDDFNGVSWASNFVEDTPAPVLFSGEVKIAAGKYFVLPVDKITSFTAFTADDITTASCTGRNDICKVNVTNDNASAGIYFGRIGGTATFNYPQRIFLSATNTGTVKLLLRGPQTSDPMNPDEISDRIPGDQASGNDTYSFGDKFHVLGDQVFDMRFDVSGKTYYGKIVVRSVELATATDPESEMTVDLTVIVQPDTAGGNQHYFQ